MGRYILAGGGTGGHLYPALALGTELGRLRPGSEVHFIGAERGVEARVLPAMGVPHTLLPLEPLRRSRVWENWRLIPSTLRGWRSLVQLFGRVRPELVVGTGGYASGLACAYALWRRVPLAIHEQNSYPGLTTRILARWARQVHLGFPEAAEHLSPGRRTEVVVTGNAIRRPDTTLDRSDSRAAFGLAADGVTALIVGGSQGSRALNESVLGALEGLAAGRFAAPPPGFQLLWSTGPTHYESVLRRLEPLGLSDWVHIQGYIESIPTALAAADLAVSRAGAIGTAELLAWGIPSILVPLPTSAADHQVHNARSLADAGAALSILEEEATPERLWSELIGLASDEERRADISAHALERARPNAAEEIAERLLELVEVRDG